MLQFKADEAAKFFWDWFEAEGIVLPDDPMAAFSTLFGEVGFKAYILSGRNRQPFDAIMLAQQWRAEHLGSFGEWAVAAGVEPHMHQILKAALAFMYAQGKTRP